MNRQIPTLALSRRGGTVEKDVVEITDGWSVIKDREANRKKNKKGVSKTKVGKRADYFTG